jgi:SAM-dependent methyltransferase
VERRYNMANRKTGWERSNRSHFDEIVISYDKVRPEYPGEMFEDIIQYTGWAKGGKALEIGAGTGKATAPLLSAGWEVTAVEVGLNMAAFLREKFRGNKNFKVTVSSFEDAMLKEESYDLIYAASAFHWVDAKIGCPKAFCLLKSGGTFALMRYNPNPPAGDELYEEIQAVYEKYYYSYYELAQRPKKKSDDEFWEPSEISRGYGFEDIREYGFYDVHTKLYPSELIYGADEYIAFLDTLADHKGLPDSNREALYEGIGRAISGFGGSHKVQYMFQLYMGRKP